MNERFLELTVAFGKMAGGLAHVDVFSIVTVVEGEYLPSEFADPVQVSSIGLVGGQVLIVRDPDRTVWPSVVQATSHYGNFEKIPAIRPLGSDDVIEDITY